MSMSLRARRGVAARRPNGAKAYLYRPITVLSRRSALLATSSLRSGRLDSATAFSPPCLPFHTCAGRFKCGGGFGDQNPTAELPVCRWPL